MTPTYRIKDWDKNFEKADKRTKALTWVAVPNKHDGAGYRRLMRGKGGHEHYVAWILLLQVASKCPVRGTLASDEGPLTAEDLELRTDCPAKVFMAAFGPLCAIGWLEIVDPPSASVDSENSPEGLGASRKPSGDSPEGSRRLPVDPPSTDRQTGHDSTEPECSVPEATASPVLDFPVVGQGEPWHLMDDKVREYETAFPDLDVLAECRKARQWTIDNPSRQKTAKGMGKFLFGWLERAQNGNGRRKTTAARDAPDQPEKTKPISVEEAKQRGLLDIPDDVLEAFEAQRCAE